jgi:N-acetylglucosaminyl-diphospho-decaprenol L-rhamnosyltransferase
MTDVATIIVNYRTPAATIEAVAALLKDLEDLEDPLVVVVDNDSGDGSAERLQQEFSQTRWNGRVVVVAADHNGGFGSGVNVGVQYVINSLGAPRYFYILNPDATIDPGALTRLVAFMADHADAGLLGNEVRNQADDVVKAFRFPSVLGELEGTARFGLLSALLRNYVVAINPTNSCEVDWVSGVSMLFRGEVFSTVGFFDEGFFLYFEEIDFAKRTRQAGWKIYFVAEVGVGHIGALSTGMRDSSRRMPRYWFESRRRYFVKHHGRLYAAACDAAWLCGHAILRVKTILARHHETFRPNIGRDFLRFSLANVLKPAPEAEQRRGLRSEQGPAARTAG